MYPKFLMNAVHVLQGQSLEFKSFIFSLKLFKLSAFFNSGGMSFQRIAPIVLTVSKPNLLVLTFCLFTVTPELTL